MNSLSLHSLTYHMTRDTRAHRWVLRHIYITMVLYITTLPPPANACLHSAHPCGTRQRRANLLTGGAHAPHSPVVVKSLLMLKPAAVSQHTPQAAGARARPHQLTVSMSSGMLFSPAGSNQHQLSSASVALSRYTQWHTCNLPHSQLLVYSRAPSRRISNYLLPSAGLSVCLTGIVTEVRAVANLMKMFPTEGVTSGETVVHITACNLIILIS